ncbi:hypothetical protein [Legionella busanensis]|nr:hypothetical protein [Legionella busanensis]
MKERLELNDNISSTRPVSSTSSKVSSEVSLEETLAPDIDIIETQAYALEEKAASENTEDNLIDTHKTLKKRGAIGVASAELAPNTEDNSSIEQIKKTKPSEEKEEVSHLESGKKTIDNDDACNNNNSEIIHSMRANAPFYKTNIMPGLSFIVLNQYGVVIGAGRKAYPKRLDESFLLPNAQPYKGTYSYRSAYMAFDSEIKTTEGEEEPVQVFFMIGLEPSGDSNHGNVNTWAMLPSTGKALAEEKIKKLESKKAKYSGECESDLTEQEFQQSVLGYRLTRMRFNLRGTKTNNFRNNIKEDPPKKDEDIPALVTHLPEELIDFSDEHDRLIKSKIQAAKSLKNSDGEKSNVAVATSTLGLFATNQANSVQNKSGNAYEIKDKDDQLNEVNNVNNNTDENTVNMPG